MRIYLNTSALNRPLDDLSSERVRVEAEAMVALLAAIEDGFVEWVGSEYLEFEIGQDPDGERVNRVRSLLALVRTRVPISEAVANRARAIERIGLRGIDALHVAAAEAGQADLLVTTDDRMLRRAARAALPLPVRLVTPLEAMALLPRRGTR
jgi:predicted nucleic acid-binding protein